jgi:hypothetical protein
MQPHSTHDAGLRRLRDALVCSVLFLAATLPALAEGTLAKAKASGKLSIGYLADAQPFSYTDAAGKPTGYAIALCSKVGDAVKNELKLPALALDFVAVSKDERFSAVAQGKIDLLCGANETLERRGAARRRAGPARAGSVGTRPGGPSDLARQSGSGAGAARRGGGRRHDAGARAGRSTAADAHRGRDGVGEGDR